MVRPYILPRYNSFTHEEPMPIATRLRPWKWPEMRSYNGFVHDERVRGGQLIWWLIDNGWMLPARVCSISASTQRVQYHCEDYYSPWNALPVAQPIHMALHRRFREPDVWREIVDRHAKTGDEWFCHLPELPVDLASEIRAREGVDVCAIFSRAPLPNGIVLPDEIKLEEQQYMDAIGSGVRRC